MCFRYTITALESGRTHLFKPNAFESETVPTHRTFGALYNNSYQKVVQNNLACVLWEARVCSCQKRENVVVAFFATIVNQMPDDDHSDWDWSNHSDFDTSAARSRPALLHRWLWQRNQRPTSLARSLWTLTHGASWLEPGLLTDRFSEPFWLSGHAWKVGATSSYFSNWMPQTRYWKFMSICFP